MDHHLVARGFAVDAMDNYSIPTPSHAAQMAIAHALIAIAEELRTLNQRAEDELEQRDIERAAFHKLWQAGPDGH